MTVAERIRAGTYPPGERRVADLILRDPGTVAFGTVAGVAAAAGVGNSTVMRFATTAGYPGFRALQDAIRSELGGRLRQATQRVRQPRDGDPVERALAAELANLETTFARLDRRTLGRAAERLARAGHVAILAGDGARGIATDLAAQLGMLRRDVELVDAGPVALGRALSWLDRDDLLVVIDTARYEGTVADAVTLAADAGVAVLALSDSHRSPVASRARWSFEVSDTGAGPFDSFVAALALTNLLVALVTELLGRGAVRHLDRLDATWDAAGALRPSAPGGSGSP